MRILISGAVHEPLARDNYGRYVKTHKEWSLDNFNDGYVDADGRFRVWLPNHHRASKDGRVLRSIVAYEAYTGDIVSKEYVVHHKNKIRLDDSDGNLEKMLFGEHSRMHSWKDETHLDKVCVVCGRPFKVKEWRMRTKGHVGKYCSLECFFNRGSSK